MPAPYGDGLYLVEPPSGYGLNIADLFHIVNKKQDDPDNNSAADSQYPNVAIITFDKQNQFGGLWANQQLDLTMPFSAEMYLYQGRQYGSSGTNIADGITFTLHNDPAGINAIGGAGEGLGAYHGRKFTGAYWQGIPLTVPHGTYLRNSLVLEFDTYRNLLLNEAFVDDPPGTAHCAVLIPRADIIYQENHNNTVTYTPQRDWVRFAARWTPNGNGGGTLSYEFGDNIRESFLVLNIQSTFGGEKVWWGFTGAAGNLTSVQAVALTQMPNQGLMVEKTVKNAAGTDINHQSVMVGDIITYTIRATAVTLTSPIGRIKIEDGISAFAEFVEDSVQVITKGGGSYSGFVSYDSGTGILSVDSTQYLSADNDWVEISFKVKILDMARGRTIYNQAAVNADNLPEQSETNATEVTVFAAPRKFISESSGAGKGGSAVKPGDLITYEIEYANDTNAPAKIVITDTLIPEFDYEGVSDGGRYDETTRTVTWTFENVPVSTVKTVKLTVLVNEKAVVLVENLATVAVNDVPLNTESVINPVAPRQPVKRVSDISEMGKNGSDVKSGDRVTYEISYLNYTEDEAAITITDRLPFGVEYISSNPAGDYNSATHTVTWKLPAIASAVSGVVTVMVRVNKLAVGQIMNYAVVEVEENERQNTNIVVNMIRGYRCMNLSKTTKCRMVVKGQKTWDDDNNSGKTRPATVEIMLYREGEPYQCISVDSENGWTYEFICLPIWKNSREKYVYEVDELTDPKDYRKKTDGYNIKNTLIKI